MAGSLEKSLSILIRDPFVRQRDEENSLRLEDGQGSDIGLSLDKDVFYRSRGLL